MLKNMVKKIMSSRHGKLPIEQELTKLCDTGKVELYNGEFVERMGTFLSGLK